MAEKEFYSLPVGWIPEWLLKAETGKGLWEHLIPDKEARESLLARMDERIKERSRWKRGELFYQE